MKRFSLLTICLMALSVVSVAPVASAQAPSFARQGDTMHTTDGASCTIGYVEPDRAWTAAHCGLNGQAVYNHLGSHIGTLRYFRDGGSVVHDLAYVQFAEGVVPLGNPLSGDGINPAPPMGETVCVTSHRRGHHCGPVTRGIRSVPGGFSTVSLHMWHGDSGSGAFVPGRPGIVGILTAGAWDSHGAFTELSALPSPDQRANLPYQGRVARKPDSGTGKIGLEELPAELLRRVVEPMEAMSSTSSRGNFFDHVLGVLSYLGLDELVARAGLSS